MRADNLVANQLLLAQSIDALADHIASSTGYLLTPVTFANLPATPSTGMLAVVTDDSGPATWGSAAFTPDGNRVVVLFSDGHGVVWPVSVAAWLRHARAVAWRNLTRDEWARYIGSVHYERTCSP